MGRKAILNDEQVFIVRNDAKKQGLKGYAADFGVSIPTLVNAKKGRAPYDKAFTKEFEDAMVEKYFYG